MIYHDVCRAKKRTSDILLTNGMRRNLPRKKRQQFSCVIIVDIVYRRILFPVN